MKIIIDTHIFLWALDDPGKIEPHKRTELETVANTVYVSSISIVEIMMKASRFYCPGCLAVTRDGFSS